MINKIFRIKSGVILTFYTFLSNKKPFLAFYCCEMYKKSKSHPSLSKIFCWSCMITVDHTMKDCYTYAMFIDHAMKDCWSYAMIIDHCHESLLIIHDQHWSVYHIVTTNIDLFNQDYSKSSFAFCCRTCPILSQDPQFLLIKGEPVKLEFE